MFIIDNRKVRIVTGTKSQTVNICTEEAFLGKYDSTYRINDIERFVTQDLLISQKFKSVRQLARHLVEQHGARLENTDSNHYPGDYLPRVIDHDANWASKYVSQVDQCLNRLVDAFIRSPYLHRVEHSLHCELYHWLLSLEWPNETFEMDGYSYRTLQKEWPETIPRPDKSRRRGSFDLAILGPRKGTELHLDLSSYCDGLLKPAFVFELGLDYGLNHLQQDELKLLNSEIQNGYLIHFARDTGESQKGVEEYVLGLMGRESSGGPKIAYASHSGGSVKVRRIGEQSIAATG